MARSDERFWDAELHRLQGELLLIQSAPDLLSGETHHLRDLSTLVTLRRTKVQKLDSVDGRRE